MAHPDSSLLVTDPDSRPAGNETAPMEFSGEIDGDPVEFSYVILAPNVVRGTLSGLDKPLLLDAERRGAQIVGELNEPGEGYRLPLVGTLQGDSIRLLIGPAPDDEEVLTATLFRRDASRPASAAQAAATGDWRGDSRPPSSLQVAVNGKPLSDAERAQLERSHGVRFAAEGRYWYDAVSGGWGFVGGPTMGYVAPGLPFSGRLSRDASGGGTQIIVNGRALHPYDLMSLQMLVGQVNPGRYFLNANGNMGLEGGPALVNLLQQQQLLILQQQAQAQQFYGPGWGGGAAAGGNGDGWYSGITGAGGNESGGFGYVAGDGWSVSYGQ